MLVLQLHILTGQLCELKHVQEKFDMKCLMRLQGMAVGNGVTDSKMLQNSLMYFGYAHGLWGDK